jgi:type IV secretory pathway VirB10-like protein
MSVPAYILADAGWAIYVVVIVVIWIVSAIANVLNKQKEEERRRRVREQIERQARMGGVEPPQQPRYEPPIHQQPRYEPPPMPAPIPRMPPKQQPPPRMPAPSTYQQRPATPKQRPPKKVRKQQQVRQMAEALAKVAQPPAAYEPEIARIQPVASSDAPSIQRPQSAGANASMIRAWLKPATLRQQFILTELFQKPVALRDDEI